MSTLIYTICIYLKWPPQCCEVGSNFTGAIEIAVGQNKGWLVKRNGRNSETVELCKNEVVYVQFSYCLC